MAELEDDGDGLDGGYKSFVDMENFIDKLKLLDYEKDYCKGLHMKPIPRHYFALPTNPGEQFHAFISLAAWLIRAADGKMEQPQEYDDPNATISTILDEVRRIGQKVEFPPSRLKSGAGDECVKVLDNLADAALKVKRFTWEQPRNPTEEATDENIVEEDMAEEENEIKNDEPAFLDDDEDDFIEEEEGIMDLEGLRKLRSGAAAGDGALQYSKPEEVLESKTESSAWLLEVERVMPQLKVTIRSEAKDWRSHLDQMHQHKGEIDKCQSEAKAHLDRLHEELSRALEKIASREKYLNNQLEHLLNEYRSTQDQLAETKEKYKQASGGITQRTRTLAEITEELERIKSEMDDRGSSMTDGSPLVKIKQAIQRLKQEMVQMDIRTGVLEHILLQGQLRAKRDIQMGHGTDDDFIY